MAVEQIGVNPNLFLQFINMSINLQNIANTVLQTCEPQVRLELIQRLKSRVLVCNQIGNEIFGLIGNFGVDGELNAFNDIIIDKFLNLSKLS